MIGLLDFAGIVLPWALLAMIAVAVLVEWARSTGRLFSWSGGGRRVGGRSTLDVTAGDHR